MRKLFRNIFVLALCSSVIFFSCANGATGNGGDSGTGNNGGTSGGNTSANIGGVKFNFSNAKAIASVESTASRSARAAGEDDAPLIKILEDGSTESAVELPDDSISMKISKIIKSPDANSKDIYLLLENTVNWYKNNKNYSLGRFICVHEDGTVTDILKKENETDSWNGYYDMYNTEVKFDAAGNAYFMITDWNNNTGYSLCLFFKFDPKTKKLTQLTASVSDTSYGQFEITPDGSTLLVSGRRYGNSMATFVRAIPVVDPDGFTNIFYTSSESYQTSKLYYDDVNGFLYFQKPDYIIAKSTLNGKTFSKSMDVNNNPTIYSYEFVDYRTSSNGDNNDYEYHFFSSKPEEVLNYLKNGCYSHGEKEFNLKYFKDHPKLSVLYSEKVDLEAVKEIAESQEKLKALFGYWTDRYWTVSYWNSNSKDNKYFTDDPREHLIFKKGTEITAYEKKDMKEIDDWDLTYLDYSWDNKTSFAFADSEGLWKQCSYFKNGVNKCYLIHLTDSDGCFIRNVEEISLPNGKVAFSQYVENKLYMSYALLEDDGSETGFHQIYEVDLADGTYRNLFENVPNNTNLEVVSFSVGGNSIYFSAVRGTKIINGCVNLQTGVYQSVDDAKKLTAIYTIN